MDIFSFCKFTLSNRLSMSDTQHVRVLSGLKPTGESAHLGNLAGMILPLKSFVGAYDVIAFIPDLHALTTVKDGERLRRQAFEISLEFLAIMGEDAPVTLFLQSDIRGLAKLQCVINNVTPYSLMLRAHSFKDAQAKNADINMGTFNYPILMAADIIGYDIDIVPVGKDQKQHLEFARDIAESFNRTYEVETFRLPEPRISEVPTLPGLDGRKMSKSYNNFIGVFEDEAPMRKKVMSIQTDSRGVDEPKDPSTCNVFAYIEVFASEETREYVRERYLRGGMGYGEAKKILAEALIAYLAPLRERRNALLAHPETVRRKLAEGSERMNAILDAKMREVCEVVGIAY